MARTSSGTEVGTTFHYAASAAALDLAAIAGKPQRCPRRIVAMAAGNWTLLKDAQGADAPPGAVFQGFVHDASTSVITSSAAIMVYW